jgi:prolyl-tRNA synthetase
MALRHTRASNYPDWYQEIITAADMAENSVSPGCMVIKPWGYGLWESVRKVLDEMFSATGHENYYFPLFIPLHFFQKEADHVEGFAKEMALVTHSKLRQNSEGKLIPDGELEEPLVVRPTSETIIANAFAKWIVSYRDLPVLLNQWANVVRWEMRPRLFLRTREFLWQEGHTAHATAEEARAETMQMLEIYRRLAEDYMAMPVLVGRKPEHEKFPGAVDTFSIEAMMQDGKALQAGTSHFLGQNFAKSANVTFCNSEGKQEYVYTTSWGASTRLIGGLIMTHGDDEGMNTPPRIALQQVVIVPMIKNTEERADIMRYISKLTEAIAAKTAFDEKIRVKVDMRNKDSVDMYWSWARKGVPLIIEVGKRDVDSDKVMIKIRDRINTKEAKQILPFAEAVASIPELLQQIQKDMFNRAKKRLQDNIRTDIKTLEQLRELFKDKNSFIADGETNKPAFVLAKWSGDAESLPVLKEMGLTMRNYPVDMQDNKEGTCIFTGKPATDNIIISRAY